MDKKRLLLSIVILSISFAVGLTVSLSAKIIETQVDDAADAAAAALKESLKIEDVFVIDGPITGAGYEDVSDFLKSSYKDKKNKNKDKDKTQVVIVPAEEPEYEWTPSCKGANEYWSSSIKCDVHCDFDGEDGGYDDHDGGAHTYFRSNVFSRRRDGCYRSVSDVLLEQGETNVTTRESLGFQPETKEEYEARMIDLDMVRQLRKAMARGGHHQYENDKYVVVEQDNPPYLPPVGRCVCKNGFARLNGKCVRYGFCPCKL